MPDSGEVEPLHNNSVDAHIRNVRSSEPTISLKRSCLNDQVEVNTLCMTFSYCCIHLFVQPSSCTRFSSIESGCVETLASTVVQKLRTVTPRHRRLISRDLCLYLTPLKEKLRIDICQFWRACWTAKGLTLFENTHNRSLVLLWKFNICITLKSAKW